MAEYIEREAAKAVIKRRLGTLDLFESRFNADIDAAPAADVVEVVRCKDCKNSKSQTRNGLYCFSPQWDLQYGVDGVRVDEDDFCSYGERKDDATS